MLEEELSRSIHDRPTRHVFSSNDPHQLALGMYSVHTSQRALDQGEAKIAEIGKRLRAEGRL